MTTGVGSLAVPIAHRQGRRIAARHWLIAALFLSTFGLAAGGSRVALLGDAGACALAVTMVARGFPSRGGVARSLVVLCYCLFLMYVVAAFGANNPGLYGWSLGARKSIAPWLFLVAGACWPAEDTQRVGRALSLLLGVSVVVSLGVHTLLPGVEATISRSADVYTGLFEGKQRLQGVFAGPFHVAMAASVLVAVSVSGAFRLSSRVRLTLAAAGLLAVWEASVRSGWIAAGAAAVLCLILLPSSNRFGRGARLLPVLAAFSASAALGASVLGSFGNRAISSLANWSQDSRLTNREQDWVLAKHLVALRPLEGWGSGSAGDTLERYFVGREHVTAHNLILKYAVEVGIPGAAVVVALLGAVVAALWRKAPSRERAVGLALLAILLAFGATGSAVDAAPVSWILLMLCGISVAPGIER